jgi:excinuclease ABC subunit C
MRFAKLKGNFKESMKDFKRVMTDLALNMHFEEAQKIKEKIEILENYQSRSTIVNPITNIDVFSIVSESAAYVNFLQISTVPSFDPTLWKSKKSSTKPMRNY